MKKKIFGFLILLIVFITSPVSAKEINDFYSTSGNNVKLEDTINGDSAIAGNIIDMIGNIDGIGFIAGETVNVKGSLEYGFMAGNNITVDGVISKNIYAAGNIITFTKNASIGRDIFLAGNEVVLNGNLDRNISISATRVILEDNLTINGNIKINASSIVVKNGANIKGELSYNEDINKDISNTANIGKITTYKIEKDSSFDVKDLLQSTLNMIIVFLVITIIIPKSLEKSENIYNESNKYAKNIGIGALFLICVPLISLLLILSNIGVSLGIILGLIYGICIYLSYIVSGFILGNLLLGKVMKLNTNKYLSGIIGIVIIKIVSIIPIFGVLISILALLLGLGTIWNLIGCSNNKKEEPKTNIVDAEIKEKSSKEIKEKSKIKKEKVKIHP